MHNIVYVHATALINATVLIYNVLLQSKITKYTNLQTKCEWIFHRNRFQQLTLLHNHSSGEQGRQNTFFLMALCNGYNGYKNMSHIVCSDAVKYLKLTEYVIKYYIINKY